MSGEVADGEGRWARVLEREVWLVLRRQALLGRTKGDEGMAYVGGAQRQAQGRWSGSRRRRARRSGQEAERGGATRVIAVDRPTTRAQSQSRARDNEPALHTDSAQLCPSIERDLAQPREHYQFPIIASAMTSMLQQLD